MTKATNVYLSDLMTGLLAALAVRRCFVLSLRDSRFERALERLNAELRSEAEKRHLVLRFRIKTHPLHGDSTQVQQALYEAARRDLISLDNPEFQDLRLKISEQEAPAYLKDLPGDPEMYSQLADRFVAYYREAPVG